MWYPLVSFLMRVSGLRGRSVTKTEEDQVSSSDVARHKSPAGESEKKLYKRTSSNSRPLLSWTVITQSWSTPNSSATACTFCYMSKALTGTTSDKLTSSRTSSLYSVLFSRLSRSVAKSASDCQSIIYEQ